MIALQNVLFNFVGGLGIWKIGYYDVSTTKYVYSHIYVYSYYILFY